MRIYEVMFAHIRYGENFSRERVAVRGYVPEAIKKALRQPEVQKWNGSLRVESVNLIASDRG